VGTYASRSTCRSTGAPGILTSSEGTTRFLVCLGYGVKTPYLGESLVRRNGKELNLPLANSLPWSRVHAGSRVCGSGLRLLCGLEAPFIARMASARELEQFWKGAAAQGRERYSNVKLIGSGAYSVVARATDAANGKMVAIKRIAEVFYDAQEAKKVGTGARHASRAMEPLNWRRHSPSARPPPSTLPRAHSLRCSVRFASCETSAIPTSSRCWR
jgi:hypothetical protein